jgi:predicted phage tail protein
MAAYTATEGIYQDYEGSFVFSQPVPELGPPIRKLEQYYSFGQGYQESVTALSFSSIETYDLISEGEVHGLVSGYYSYSGTEGNVGWSSKSFTPYLTPSGLSDVPWLRSIFWNEIPLVDSDGKYNFSSFNVSVSRGTDDGYLLTDSSSNNEITVTRPIGERLRAASNPIVSRVSPYADDYAKTYRISNKDVSSCYVDIRVPALYKQVIESDLSTYSTEIVYSIYYRAIYTDPTKIKDFILAKEEKIEGNINTDYIRRSRIDFASFGNESDFVAWEIKIIRETEDSTSTYLQNKSFVEAITEIYENNFLYPKCSVARTKFDAREFNGIPSRYYHMRLKKIKVPNNYDPELRSYGDSTLSTTTGTQGSDYWNGEFKEEKEYSNNPAWVLYDIMTDKTYGLGRRISERDVSASKWDLYQISKNCDTLVSDGEGGLEPRFACNAYIASKEEAYKVINDLSSVFNGIPYYQGGSIFFSQDRYKGDPVYTFTNANVEDGNFKYFSTSKKNRYTVSVVRYNDKNNYYRPNFEYVEDIDGIKRYGIQEVELTSFATTSRGQAIRAGRWTLESSKQKETVSFVAGLEAQTLRIGDLFQVHDSNRKGFYEAGRISQCFTTGTGLILDLDRELSYSSGKNYDMKVLGSTFKYDPTLVDIESSSDYSNIKRNFIQTVTISDSYFSSLSDGRTRITFPSSGVFDFDNYDLFTNNNVWTANLASGESAGSLDIGLSSDQYSYYTCANISQTDDHKYEIMGLEYFANKFDTISSEITPDYSDTVVNTILNGPNNLSLSYDTLTRNIDFEFDGISSSLLSHYEVFVQIDSDPDPSSLDATMILSKTTTSGSYTTTNNGTYYFRVYSVSIEGTRSSSYTSSVITISGINPTESTIISSLQIDPNSVLKEGNISNNSGETFFEEYVSESPAFSWQVGYSSSLVQRNNTYRISIRPPSSSNTPDSTIYYQETGYQSPFLADSYPSYVYNISANSLNSVNGPHRHYDVVVESYNPIDYSTSAGNQLDPNVGYPYVSSETWSNTNGYDILEVNNYPITGYRLTDRITGETTEQTINTYGSQIATDQWISTDGSIKFTIVSGSSGITELPENMRDIHGAFVYYSASSFTSGDAYSGNTGIGYVEVPMDSDSFGFGNVYTADAKLSDETNSQFISISLMDRFDSFAIKAGMEGHRTGVGMSNTVEISRRGVGAPTGTEYVLLSSEPKLPNSRVLTGGSGMSLFNDGTNVSIDFDPSSLDYLGSSDTTLTGDELLLVRGSVPYRKSYGDFNFGSSSRSSETLQIQVPVTSSASEGSEWYPRSIVFNNYNETNFVYTYWGKPSGLDTTIDGTIEILFRGLEHDSLNPRYYYDLEMATGVDSSTGFEGSVIVSDYVDTTSVTDLTFFRKRHSIPFNSLSDDVSTLYFKLTRVDGVSGQDLTASGISLSSIFLGYNHETL